MTKRKVRKDFDKNQPITVDVSNSSVEEEKKVRQAFFDIGIKWVFGGETYGLLNKSFYTNVTSDCDVISSLLWVDRENLCSIVKPITPKEFFDMVYEVEDKEMEGYIKVDDLNSFKWILKDASKDVYIEFIKRGVLAEAFHNFENMDFCHNLWGCVVSAGIHALDKYKDKAHKEVFFKDGEFYTKDNAIEFNYEEYCKGGYVAKIRSGLKVTQIKKFDIEGVFPIAGVVGGHTIQTWTDGGSSGATSYKTDADLVMYKV